MAVLATATLQEALVEPGGSRSAALISTLVLFAAPTVALSWLFATRQKPSKSRHAHLARAPDHHVTVIGMIVLLGLPFVVEACAAGDLR